MSEKLKLTSILLKKEEIEKRVSELASEIESEYRGQEVIIVGVLKGATIFVSDLVRSIGESVDVRMDFMAVSSYGDSMVSSGVVRIIKDMDSSAAGKNIILVEDIVDSGLTLYYLRDIMMARGPATFKTCALLDKPDRKKVDAIINYKGFTIPDKFVVGYGLDYSGRWRHLSDIWCLESSSD